MHHGNPNLSLRTNPNGLVFWGMARQKFSFLFFFLAFQNFGWVSNPPPTSIVGNPCHVRFTSILSIIEGAYVLKG